MKLHALKSTTRGASATEYALLLSLIGGIGLIAVLSFSHDARRAFDISTAAIASTVPGLSSTPGGAEAVFPDPAPVVPAPVVPDPTPTPPPVPVLLYSETVYTLRGAWMPYTQATPAAGYYNTYTPETLTLTARNNDLSTARLGAEDLYRVGGMRGLDYQSAGGQWSHSPDRMDAFTLYTTRPGHAFVVPLPSRSQQSIVDSGAAFRVYMTQAFSLPASGSSLPVALRSTGVETAYYDCGGETIARPVVQGALSVCPNV